MYFLAKVEIDPDQIANTEGLELIPGMPAEVLTLDDERSFLRYLLDPITSSFSQSFREH